MRYQRYYAEKQQIPAFDSLEETCVAAFKKTYIDPYMSFQQKKRAGGERCVPLHIWSTSSFQSWYRYLYEFGNRLENARVEWTFRVGPNKDVVFFWILHVDIYIAAEDRHKTNEVVIGRPDISSIMLYERKENILDSRIVIVKEFRSPVSNIRGYVYELAGGSSWDVHADPFAVAVEECFEEVGLRLPVERLRGHETRQLCATTLAHRAHFFTAELTTEEMDQVAANSKTVRGVEADTERTWAEVRTYADILAHSEFDWSTVGMIASVLR
jgi:8-oxo-dGTP pyrophosphatase MutT (NUDIX family)